MSTAAAPTAIHAENRLCSQPAPMPADRAALLALAGPLKAAADPTRLGILSLLGHAESELCVCEITPHFDLQQPTISHHLRLLREAGLIDTAKRGIWGYYWATASGRALLAALNHLAATADFRAEE